MKSTASLEVLCLIILSGLFFFLPYSSSWKTGFKFGVFIEFLCVHAQVSLCLYKSLVLFCAYILVWLFFHILICFLFILLLFLRCLFVSKQETEVCGSGWKGRWNCENQGWRNCSQNILYDKTIFNKRKKKTNRKSELRKFIVIILRILSIIVKMKLFLK